MSGEHDRVVTVSVLKSELTVLKSELKSELKSVLKSELTSVLKSGLKSELRLALTDLEQRLEKRIIEDGALTRAHFNIMVEKVNDSVRLAAEVNGHHATVLGNHESRL